MDEAEHISEFERIQGLSYDQLPLVKKVENECKFDKNITVIDLKLNAYGVYEDLYYSTFPFLIKNIRRGNTYVGV